MRSVVLACFAVAILGRPNFAQTTLSTASVNTLEDGIAVTGVGLVENFTSHMLVFSPIEKKSLFRGGGFGGGGFGGGQGGSRNPSEDQVKQIATAIRARQTALVETLEKFKLGRVKVLAAGTQSRISIGDNSYQLEPDTIYVYLTQKECDGAVFGGLTRQKFLEALKDSTEDFEVVLESSVDSKDKENQRQATARAIVNGRASAEAIAAAGGVSLMKLAAAREETSVRWLTARRLKLTSEKATVLESGGLSVSYALRFSIQ